MAKELKARVDLFSFRSWITKGTKHFSLEVHETLSKPAPNRRLRTEGMVTEYGEVVLSLIPETGGLKGETFQYSAAAKFTESIEYGKGKENEALRKFVLVTQEKPTAEQLERIYLGQGQAWDLYIKPTAEPKQINFEAPPTDPQAPVSAQGEHEQSKAGEGAAQPEAKKKRGRPKGSKKK